jgi:hypothetical protein
VDEEEPAVPDIEQALSSAEIAGDNQPQNLGDSDTDGSGGLEDKNDDQDHGERNSSSSEDEDEADEQGHSDDNGEEYADQDQQYAVLNK